MSTADDVGDDHRHEPSSSSSSPNPRQSFLAAGFLLLLVRPFGGVGGGGEEKEGLSRVEQVSALGGLGRVKVHIKKGAQRSQKRFSRLKDSFKDSSHLGIHDPSWLPC